MRRLFAQFCLQCLNLPLDANTFGYIVDQANQSKLAADSHRTALNFDLDHRAVFASTVKDKIQPPGFPIE